MKILSDKHNHRHLAPSSDHENIHGQGGDSSESEGDEGNQEEE